VLSADVVVDTFHASPKFEPLPGNVPWL